MRILLPPDLLPLLTKSAIDIAAKSETSTVTISLPLAQYVELIQDCGEDAPEEIRANIVFQVLPDPQLLGGALLEVS